MGHLSRSCPDNPKGLYAEGGCTYLLKPKHVFDTYVTQSKVTLKVNEDLIKRSFRVSFTFGKSALILGNLVLILITQQFLVCKFSVKQ